MDINVNICGDGFHEFPYNIIGIDVIAVKILWAFKEMNFR